MLIKKKNIIKVANIIEEARIGGPQLRLLSVARSLKNKIDVTIIFPQNNSKKFQMNCKALNVKYLTSPITSIHRNYLKIIKFVILFPYETLKLTRLLKKHNFDLIHLSGGSWQYKGLIAAKLAGLKIIWELNDTYVPKVIKFIFYFLNKFANHFLYSSYRTKSYYEKKISKNKKYFLIQSPVSTKLFDPELKYPQEKFIKNLKKKIIVGTICNVNPVKDLITLIKSARQLSSCKDKIIFIVVGSVYETQKKYYKTLIDLVKSYNLKNFKFISSRTDVRPILKRIDIYVCSSKNESSPLSVWEAMSMEKAVISTNVGDVGQYIIDNKNGFIINTGDYINMAKKISELVNKPKLRIKFGKNSRKVAKKKLELKICSAQHLQMYKEVLNMS